MRAPCGLPCLVAMVAFALLGLAGCATPGLHSPCNGFDSCGAEMVCRHSASGGAGTCEMPCRNEGDCPMGFRCSASEGVPGVAHLCVAR